MGENSKIQWTDCTDNIIVAEQGGWWCRHRSPGCDNCYAENLNGNSYFGGNHLPYRGAPPALKLQRHILEKWPRQTKPRKHFVASMTDIFGEWVPGEWVFDYLDAMHAAPRQTFQLLTKREDVALAKITAWLAARGLEALPPNMWIGFSVENRKHGMPRVDCLRRIPAAVRWLSCEPLLEDLGAVDLTGIHWVVVGGESGAKARPMYPDWARSVRDQCNAAGVPFFFKQHGEWANWEIAGLPNKMDRSKFKSHLFSERPYEDEQAYVLHRVGHDKAGRSLDGREWNEMPVTGAASHA